jgi:hypothetical protein
MVLSGQAEDIAICGGRQRGSEWRRNPPKEELEISNLCMDLVVLARNIVSINSISVSSLGFIYFILFLSALLTFLKGMLCEILPLSVADFVLFP